MAVYIPLTLAATKKPTNYGKLIDYALKRTRTSTLLRTRPSTVRVCQFRHQGSSCGQVYKIRAACQSLRFHIDNVIHLEQATFLPYYTSIF